MYRGSNLSMKTLKFKDFKARWILEGVKTATMRLFDDKDLQKGDELELVNGDTVNLDTMVKVVKFKLLSSK